ncbi:MAG: LysR family transcriptional regulator substrate-binding protein, partial [Blautia sp.]|nr:LysR family transcriptional regulator substrate-binding protein [Blautia sp.]
SDINAGAADISGDIYLGCGESHVMDYIVGIFESIHKDYPDIHFHIYSGNAESVLERLDKGLLDAGLLLGSMNNEKYDLKDLGLYDRFGLLMAQNCSLAEKEYITYEDLQNLPILMPQQSIASSTSLDEFTQTLFQTKHTVNIVGTYNLLYNAIFMVEHNIGSAICIEGLVDTNSRSNLVFKPLLPEVRLNSYLVTKKYQSFSKAMKLFLDNVNRSSMTNIAKA